MAKLKETEVLTTHVYLNIKRGKQVETAQMRTAEAMRKYGDKEVVYIYPPQYQEDMAEPELIKKARKDGVVPAETRKAGVTDIIIT
ncbi:MAG: hypothetical protein IKQ47_07615 [Prevotella sp.]|nr:hypothetical protein [Prevotella sp.]